MRYASVGVILGLMNFAAAAMAFALPIAVSGALSDGSDTSDDMDGLEREMVELTFPHNGSSDHLLEEDCVEIRADNGKSGGRNGYAQVRTEGSAHGNTTGNPMQNDVDDSGFEADVRLHSEDVI